MTTSALTARILVAKLLFGLALFPLFVASASPLLKESLVPQRDEAYYILAQATQTKLQEDYEIRDIVKALKSLSGAQKTFKSLDGAAHEAYQRTHDGSSVELSVKGRARRSAARLGATAHGLWGCELCELIVSPTEEQLKSPNGTLGAGRRVILNTTSTTELAEQDVRMVVIYEPDYSGGAGIHHETLEPPSNVTRPKIGRFLVVIGDEASKNLPDIVSVLSQKSKLVSLYGGPEVASVQPILYQIAGELLPKLEPHLQRHPKSAVHFVGYSLSGGIASLAACMLNGEISVSTKKKKPNKRKRRKSSKPSAVGGNNSTEVAPLAGLGKGRTSAVAIGAPPSMSKNIPNEYILSLMYGDDIVCRMHPESLERFLGRTERALKNSGLIARRLNWMTDTLSLAKTNLQTHAVGSDGEETKLGIPGKAYLVRPRRLKHHCSMHEIPKKGGREALRAAVLWQLNDLLLSKSLWKHHQLESYIQGLDRVQLRGVEDDR